MKIGALAQDELVEAIRTSFLKEHDTEGRQRRTHLEARLLGDYSAASGETFPPVGRPVATSAGLSLDTATGRVTVSLPGLYLCTVQIAYAAAAGGVRDARVYTDLTLLAVQRIAPSGSPDFVLVTVPVLVTRPGTTIRAAAYQDTAGAVTLDSAYTFVMVSRVA